MFFDFMVFKSKSKLTYVRPPKNPFQIRYWQKRIWRDIHGERRQLERMVHCGKFTLICACPNFNKTSSWMLKNYFTTFLQRNSYYPWDRLSLKYHPWATMQIYTKSNLFKCYGRHTSQEFKNLLTTNQIHFNFNNIKDLWYFVHSNKINGITPYLFYPLVIANRFKKTYLPIHYFKLKHDTTTTSTNLLRLNFLTILKQISINLKLILENRLDDSCEPPIIFIDLAGLPNPLHPLSGNDPRLDVNGDIHEVFDENGKLIVSSTEDESLITDCHVSSDDDLEAVAKRTWLNKFLRRTFG